MPNHSSTEVLRSVPAPPFGRVLLFSIIATIVLLSPTLLAGTISDWTSAQSVNSIDEPYYLGRAQQIARGLNPDFFYLESRDLPQGLAEAIRNDPRSLGEYLGGAIGNALGLSAVKGGVLLDFLFGLFTILLLFYLFFELSGVAFLASIATTVTVALPWSLSVQGSLPVHFLQSGLLEKYWIVTAGYPIETSSPSPSLPIFKGISSQISYPILICTLLMLVKAIKEGGPQLCRMLGIGLSVGLLFYTYIFAAGAAAGVVTVFLSMSCLSLGLTATLKNILVFFVGLLSVILPDIIAIGDSQTVEQFTIPELRQFVWLSPTLLALTSISLVLLAKTHCSSKVIALRLFCSCLIAELFLVNLQPATGLFLATFRFGELYLHPIGTGIIVILSGLLSSAYPSTRRGFIALSGTILVICLAVSAKSAIYVAQAREPQDNVVKFMRETPPDSVLAVVTNSEAFQGHVPYKFASRAKPNYIAILSERATLSQEWAPRWDSNDLRREIYLTWLYTGRLNLEWPCPENISLPGDIFILTWTATTLMRKKACEKIEQIMKDLTACKLFNNYKVDYILWEKSLNTPQPSSEFTSLAWSSPDGQEIIYKINRSKLRIAACDSI